MILTIFFLVSLPLLIVCVCVCVSVSGEEEKNRTIHKWHKTLTAPQNRMMALK